MAPPAELRATDAAPRARARRLLVLAYDVIGERMAGPGIRSWELACAVAPSTPVTVASTYPLDRAAPGVTTVRFETADEFERILRGHDAVLAQGYTSLHHKLLRSSDTLKIIDLYDPFLFTNLALQATAPLAEAEKAIAFYAAVQNELADFGDVFLCASERQRDYWLGALSARGRITPAAARADPTLRTLVDVVPYGCPDDPPQPASPVLRGVRPEIPQDAFLVVWSGGAWDWFDPVLAVDAFARVVERVPSARLLFLGLELGGREVGRQAVAAAVVERAEELGLLGSHVLVEDWVPYDERGSYLLEADCALVLTRTTSEARLAFRSRMLDHFWAGLPTVTTGGDVLSELADEAGAAVVAPAEPAGLADVLVALADDPAWRMRMAAAASSLADRFRWRRVAEPLRTALERGVPEARAPERPPETSALELHRDQLAAQAQALTAEMEVLHRELDATRQDRRAIAAELEAVLRDRAAVSAELEAVRHALAESERRRLSVPRPLRALGRRRAAG